MATWLLSGLVAGLALGLLFGLTQGIAAEVGYGVIFGLAGGMVAGTIAWADAASGVITTRLAAGLMFGVGFGLVYGLAAGLLQGLLGGRAGGLAEGLLVGLPAGLVFGLAAGLAAGFAFRSGNRIPRRIAPMRWRRLFRPGPLLVGLLAEIVTGFLTGAFNTYGAGIVTWLGAAAGATPALTSTDVNGLDDAEHLFCPSLRSAIEAVPRAPNEPYARVKAAFKPSEHAARQAAPITLSHGHMFTVRILCILNVRPVH
jgi:hypothetical protein